MAKRVRYSNLETNSMKQHQLDGQGQLKQVSEISDTDWKEKSKPETRLNIQQQNMAVLKSICFHFHDRDLTSQTEKGYIVGRPHDLRPEIP